MPGARIPNDWNGVDWACHVIEWPASPLWQAILLGQLTELKRGRFWDSESGTVTGAQAVALEIMLRNLGIGAGQMACFDDIVNAINSLSVNIKGGGCCGGTSGAGNFDDDPILGDYGPGDPGYPDGFASSSEYLAYKCGAANAIYNEVQADIAKTQLLTGFTGSIPSLATLLAAGFFAVPLSVAAIAGIAASLIVLVAATAALATISSALVAIKDDIICAIYQAKDAQEARDNLQALIDGQFDAYLWASFAEDFVFGMFSTDNVNRAFRKGNLDYSLYPGATCDCGDCTLYDFTTGANGWEAFYFGPSSPTGSGWASGHFGGNESFPAGQAIYLALDPASVPEGHSVRITFDTDPEGWNIYAGGGPGYLVEDTASPFSSREYADNPNQYQWFATDAHDIGNRFYIQVTGGDVAFNILNIEFCANVLDHTN